MKSHSMNISFTLHRLVTLALVAGILIFPIISIVASLDEMNQNFIELHDENDTSENEKLEENSKNEKKDIQQSDLGETNILILKDIRNYRLRYLVHNFILEIHIPPPDFI